MNFIEAIKQVYWLYPFYEILEKVKIYINSKKNKIIVFQMGKVGSSTVYETLKKMNLDDAIYHLHWLSDDGIAEAETFFRNTPSGKIPMHLRRSKTLKKFMDFKNDKIKIISITRDPVGRIISDIFQNLRYYYPHLIDSKSLDSTELKKILLSKFKNIDINNEYTITWFQKEFLNATHIDIYRYPFDKKKGYKIIRHNNIEILLLKMESLNKNLKSALNDFLDYHENINIVNTNIGDEKEFANEQNFIKKSIGLDKALLKEIYNSKYMKHFYTEDEIEKFQKKWIVAE